MLENNKREIFISISSNPGLFGETVHNAGYNYQKLNYFYKAIRVVNLNKTIEAIKLLNIKGCSVSMPFKEEIIKYLDYLDKDAKIVGAVNTVINKNNTLKGYNTDIFGAYKALQAININCKDSILILGAGGVARAIIIALQKQKISDIFVTNRNLKKAEELSKLFNCKFVSWEKRNNFKSSVLINTTPIGMKNHDYSTPIDVKSIKNFDKVMDVVVKKNMTSLIKIAKKMKIPFVTGLYMTFFQAANQYKIYTGIDAPLHHMVEAYNKNFNESIVLDNN